MMFMKILKGKLLTVFGLNLYTGKGDADYIRPTPKMSKGIISHTNYYRQEFHPTFHPLVYKMINSLSLQAALFQKHLDPFYDRFLVESFHHDLCAPVEESEIEIHPSSKKIEG